MKRLALQNPIWRRGHGLTAQLLGAGEVPLAWAYFLPECMKATARRWTGSKPSIPKEVYLHLDDYAREFREIFSMQSAATFAAIQPNQAFMDELAVKNRLVIANELEQKTDPLLILRMTPA